MNTGGTWVYALCRYGTNLPNIAYLDEEEATKEAKKDDGEWKVKAIWIPYRESHDA